MPFTRKTCPHCKGALIPHDDPDTPALNPAKADAAHCNDCGCCFGPDGQVRPGHTPCDQQMRAEIADARVRVAMEESTMTTTNAPDPDPSESRIHAAQPGDPSDPPVQHFPPEPPATPAEVTEQARVEGDADEKAPTRAAAAREADAEAKAAAKAERQAAREAGKDTKD